MTTPPRDVQAWIRAMRRGKARPVVRDYGDRVADICKKHGLPPPVREHRFDTRGYDPPRYDKRGNLRLRDWRWDVAWPERKVAVECHGGTQEGRGRGRHLRPEGIRADSEKSTAAQLQGWTVLTFTAEQIPDCVYGSHADRFVRLLRQALGLDD